MVVNMETVPVSGRRRFNWVSPEKEEQLGLQQFQQVLRQFRGRILPAWHPNTRMVQRVLDRLIPTSGLANQAWEVYVIDDPREMNAFVIPGLVIPGGHGAAMQHRANFIYLGERYSSSTASSQSVLARTA